MGLLDGGCGKGDTATSMEGEERSEVVVVECLFSVGQSVSRRFVSGRAALTLVWTTKRGSKLACIPCADGGIKMWQPRWRPWRKGMVDVVNKK